VDLVVKLSSLTQDLGNDWNLTNNGFFILLQKQDHLLSFDKPIPTENEFILSVDMVAHGGESAHMTMTAGLSIDITLLHELLGHSNKQTLCATAKHYNVSLKGEFHPCCECATAEINQTNFAKVSRTTSSKPGERNYIDISSVKTE
jgi:hypothetical protein